MSNKRGKKPISGNQKIFTSATSTIAADTTDEELLAMAVPRIYPCMDIGVEDCPNDEPKDQSITSTTLEKDLYSRLASRAKASHTPVGEYVLSLILRALSDHVGY